MAAYRAAALRAAVPKRAHSASRAFALGSAVAFECALWHSVLFSRFFLSVWESVCAHAGMTDYSSSPARDDPMFGMTDPSKWDFTVTGTRSTKVRPGRLRYGMWLYDVRQLPPRLMRASTERLDRREVRASVSARRQCRERARAVRTT